MKKAYKNADSAMYQAKQEIVSSYRFYSDVACLNTESQWGLLLSIA